VDFMSEKSWEQAKQELKRIEQVIQNMKKDTSKGDKKK
jgi:hypothetical protein